MIGKKYIVFLLGVLMLLPISTLGETVKKEGIPKKSVTISATGDCTLGYYVGQNTWNRFDVVAKEKGYAYFLENVKSVFESDNLTIVNLEGPLTMRGAAAKKQFAFRGLPDYVEILKKGNIEAVNLSNNHSLDYGMVGHTDTKKILQDHKIGYFGEEDICYKTINEVKVAMIGAKGWDCSDRTKNKLKELIKKAKANADLIVVEFHWGEEGKNTINAIQKNLGHFVIDEGAHLVLGSHPHVIQGIENYKGANIVYSMGNFCFGGNRNPSDKDTFIYKQSFELVNEKVVASEHEVIPCSISSVKDKNDYRPTLLSGKEKDRVLKRLKEYSKNI